MSERRATDALYASALAIVGVVAVAENRRARRLARLVLHDELTGALNLRGWRRAMRVEDARAARHGHDVAVLSFDLDHFKQLNDTHGHQAGDQGLRRVAQVLAANRRVGDCCARVGGDEWAVLAPHASTEHAHAMLERVVAQLAAAGLAASAGAAVRSETTSLEETWHLADRRSLATKRRRGPLPGT